MRNLFHILPQGMVYDSPNGRLADFINLGQLVLGDASPGVLAPDRSNLSRVQFGLSVSCSPARQSSQTSVFSHVTMAAKKGDIRRRVVEGVFIFMMAVKWFRLVTLFAFFRRLESPLSSGSTGSRALWVWTFSPLLSTGLTTLGVVIRNGLATVKAGFLSRHTGITGTMTEVFQ